MTATMHDYRLGDPATPTDPIGPPPVPPAPPEPPVEAKPGYLTSEFWVMLFTNLVSAAVGISTLLGKSIDQRPLLAIIPTAAMLAMGLATAYYSHSRGHVKAALAVANAEVRKTNAIVKDNYTRDLIQYHLARFEAAARAEALKNAQPVKPRRAPAKKAPAKRAPAQPAAA